MSLLFNSSITLDFLVLPSLYDTLPDLSYLLLTRFWKKSRSQDINFSLLFSAFLGSQMDEDLENIYFCYEKMSIFQNIWWNIQKNDQKWHILLTKISNLWPKLNPRFDKLVNKCCFTPCGANTNIYKEKKCINMHCWTHLMIWGVSKVKIQNYNFFVCFLIFFHFHPLKYYFSPPTYLNQLKNTCFAVTVKHTRVISHLNFI